jgi:hypothetical protein
MVRNEDQVGAYPDSRYDRTPTSVNPANPSQPTGSYETTTAGTPAYDSAGPKKSHFSTIGGSSYARGEIDVKVGTGYEGFYGAAFYLPPGTIRGPSPRQEKNVDIMGWDQSDANGNPTTAYGGLRIGEDHRVQLVRPPGVDPQNPSDNNIGNQFTLREGCWNWIVVHQRLSPTSSNALNEVFLNGERIVSSDKPNSTGGAHTVKWGLADVASGQGSNLDLYVDNAYVSNTDRIAPIFSSALCQPLPNVLFIVTDDQRADTIDTAMPNTKKWFKDTPLPTPSAPAAPNTATPSRRRRCAVLPDRRSSPAGTRTTTTSMSTRRRATSATTRRCSSTSTHPATRPRSSAST